MANLSVPELEFKITADGTAAVKELEKTAEATEKLEQSDAKYHKNSQGRWVNANGRYVSAKQVAEEMGQAFVDAGGKIEQAGENAESAAKGVEGLGNAGAHAGDDIGASMKRASVNVQELGQQMSSIGKGMTMALTVPIVGALAASVKGASDMTETLGKTDVVFGAMAEHVRAWSESSVSAMGMAQQTALDMAATYGDMATGMGMTQTEAANMSTSLVQLAADMASFKNISISDVNTALTAVFTGETESLKRLGIVMTQTNLQQFAYSQGIQKNIADMTQAEQVQLRYQYVMAMTANAQGDFQRTGGNLANQTRALGETVKQAGASFGELLVPAVTKVVSALRDGAQWLSELDDGTKRTILTIAMVVAAVGPLLLVGGKIITMISSIQTAMAAMSLNPVILGLAAIAAAIAATAAAVSLLDQGVDTTSDNYKRLTAAVEGGAHGELSLDTSGVPESVEVEIDADGQKALDEAQSIVDKLTSGAYDGELAIDGDPAAAQAALEELKAAIAAAKAAMTIDANGNAVLAPGGELDRLRAAIEQCKAIVAVTTDPATKAAVEAELTQLMAQFETLSVTFSVDGESMTALDTVKAKLDTMPRDQTYKNTGEFVITGASAEVITEYANAIAAAATATGDYATAAEALNKVVDQETERKKGEVYQQMTDAAADAKAMYNEGLISADEYHDKMLQIYEDGSAQVEQIEQEAEAQKLLNEQFADGSRANDGEAFFNLMDQTLGDDAKISVEDAQQSMLGVLNGDFDGDAARKALEAEKAMSGVRQQSAEDQEKLTEATKQYKDAMAEADNYETRGVAAEQDKIDRAKLLQDAVDQYSALIQNGYDPDEAIELVRQAQHEQMEGYEGLEESMVELLQGEDGQGISIADALDTNVGLDKIISDSESEIDNITKTAAENRQAATDQLATAMSEITSDYTSAEVDAQVGAMRDAGADISAAEQEMLTTPTHMAEHIAEAIASGDDGQVQEAVNAVVKMDTATDGLQQTMAGVAGAVDKLKGIDASSAGASIPETMIAGIRGGADGVAEAVRNLKSAALSGADGGGEGESLGEDLLSGVAESARSAADVTTALSSAISSAASSAGTTASSGGKSIGTNLIAGAKSGVMSAAGSLASAAASAVRAAIAAAKLAALIHSPSGVMRDEVGVQLMRGMEVGVVNRVPATIQVIKESVSGVLSGAAQVITTGGIPTPALPIPAAAGVSFDYERLADAVSERPISFRVGGKQLAAATRDEAARQQAVRVQQINAGYGGK